MKRFVDGEEAFVLYGCLTRDGKALRNTEFFIFWGGGQAIEAGVRRHLQAGDWPENGIGRRHRGRQPLRLRNPQRPRLMLRPLHP
ncbi:MAG: hypothetical protein J2P50_11140 [Hyphomicrobiaceae bacterium]|nr:hypothetical protein [Hyphomicrobiaceae bacterium]